MSVESKTKTWLENNRNRINLILHRAKVAQARLVLARRVNFEDLKKPMR